MTWITGATPYETRGHFGMVVAIAVGLVGAIGFWIVSDWIGAEFAPGWAAFKALFPCILSVIALFLMMGVFATHCGVLRDLYRAANVLPTCCQRAAGPAARWAGGGRAVAAIVTCAGFGEICGSSLVASAMVAGAWAMICAVARPRVI